MSSSIELSQKDVPWLGRVVMDGTDLLKSSGVYRPPLEHVPWVRIFAWMFAAGVVYGATMGSFAGHPLQSLYSALKVPLLIFGATLVCLPSFFVINTMLGLRDDFGAAMRGILASQATLALLLASLAPVTLVMYASSADYGFAVAINGMAFLLGSAAAHTTLGRHYAPLTALNGRHRWARLAWLVVFMFVTIQLAWMLRPFVGSPNLPAEFVRSSSWSNAYVVVAKVIADLIP